MRTKKIAIDQVYSNNYLNRLKSNYPNVLSCQIAIAELYSYLKLPAGTNYYFSDIHAQGDKFFHVVNSRTGMLQRKLEKVIEKFYQEKKIDNLSDAKKNELLKLCYYPRDVIKNSTSLNRDDIDMYITILSGLINLSASKHSSFGTEKIIKIHGGKFFSTIKELININREDRVLMLDEYQEKDFAQKVIVDYFIENGVIIDLIEKMTDIFKELTVFRYIINGDVPDRGQDTAKILDHIIKNNMIGNWGNHDLLWMGAAAGNKLLILDMIRIQYRYSTESILENDYGIDLTPLVEFVKETYKSSNHSLRSDIEKALLIIATKIESNAERSERLEVYPYLSKDNFYQKNGEYFVLIKEKEYLLNTQDFPTIISENPSQLTTGEQKILEILKRNIKNSDRFQDHWSWIAKNWGMYTFLDGILSFHATVPVTLQSEMAEVEIMGKTYSGKDLFDRLNEIYQSPFKENSFIYTEENHQEVMDLFYRGWKGRNSWTFGKKSMTTFARYFINDKNTHNEKKSAYYQLLNDPQMSGQLSESIISDFCGKENLGNVHIYNGHVPIKLEKGEDPVKGNGMIFCGDGGFSKAYGDVGFALVDSSRGLYFYKLGSAMTKETVLKSGSDIAPSLISTPLIYQNRKQLADCNIAPRIYSKISALTQLISEYQKN